MKVQIGKLFNLEKGSLQSTKCSEGKYTFITAAEEWKTHNEYTHECEALIFAAAASGSLGRAHYVNNKFISSDLCFIMTPKQPDKYPVNLQFYHFVFNALKNDIVAKTKSGTSKESINQKNIRAYKLPYFDLKQQNFWIGKLVHTKEKLNSLSTEITHQQTLLKKFRQSILQDAISGKLTKKWRKENPDIEPASELLKRIKVEKERMVKEKKINKQKPLTPIKEDEIPFELPEGWVWCRLGNSGLFERGKSKHRPRNDESLFVDGTYPFIQTGNVAQSKKNGYIIESYDKYYNKKGLAQSRLWPEGTLCITIAANIAETGFLGIDACFPDSVVGFTSLFDKALPNFIRLYIDATKSDIEHYAPATAQKNINLGIIGELLFPMPPEKEIISIVNKVEGAFKLCDQLESQITKSQKDTEFLMQAVLKDAFSGGVES
jgi:type I restriction enzyme S subunit